MKKLDQKKMQWNDALQEIKISDYFGNTIIGDGQSSREIYSKISQAKNVELVNKKKNLFTSKNTIVNKLLKRYIWRDSSNGKVIVDDWGARKPHSNLNLQ